MDFLRWTVTAWLMLAPALASAANCEGFKWDVTRERDVFAQQAHPAVTVAEVAKAPLVETEALYQLKLLPQEQIRLAAPPGKKSIADGAYAGLVRFRVPTAGTYRVALDHGFWIDVVADGKAIPSIDFSGSPDCSAPRKVVAYELPAGQDLVLQLSGAIATQVRFSITAVANSYPTRIEGRIHAPSDPAHECALRRVDESVFAWR